MANGIPPLSDSGPAPVSDLVMRIRTTPYIGMRVLVFNPPFHWFGTKAGEGGPITRILDGEPCAGTIVFIAADGSPPRVNVAAYDHIGCHFALTHIPMLELRAGDELAIGYGRFSFCTPHP